jgi:hypothetical protein
MSGTSDQNSVGDAGHRNQNKPPPKACEANLGVSDVAMRSNKYPDESWLARYQARVNTDQELSVIGDWFTTTFALTFGDDRYALRIEKGKIAEIINNPRIDVRTAFGFRAPVSVWQKFLSPDPPPLYHDFFAMLMRVPEFTLEGDSVVAMQNARALHRMMNIMRETGAPDV